jgi:isoleucyl-tRNA synthetase
MTEIDRYALALTARLQAAVVEDYQAYQFHLVTQKLQSFCSEDLGAFYLDICKDRLYTCGKESRARRSAQTALWNITNSLLRLMAPILSFTAEEAWQVFGGKWRGRASFEETWHGLPNAGLDATVIGHWESGAPVPRAGYQADRRKARSKGGRLLAARRSSTSEAAWARPTDALARLEDELRFRTDHIGARPSTRAAAAAGEGEGDTHPNNASAAGTTGRDVNPAGLCGRCEGNLKGPGEPRRYA